MSKGIEVTVVTRETKTYHGYDGLLSALNDVIAQRHNADLPHPAEISARYVDDDKDKT